MAKVQLNQSLLFVLIIAFLSMQCASAHIHLAEHHSHDNSHHQHDIEVHSHQSIDHHTDSLNFSHQSNDINIIELDHEFNSQKVEKPEKPSTVFITLAFPHLSIISHSSTRLPNLICTNLNYLSRSTVKSRAPPYFS